MVVPAGDGETGNGRTWRVVTQQGSVYHSGYVRMDSAKSRAEYIRAVALKLSVDADDISWWMDRDIQGYAQHYLAERELAEAASGNGKKQSGPTYRTVTPGTIVRATDKGQPNFGTVVSDNGKKLRGAFPVTGRTRGDGRNRPATLELAGRHAAGERGRRQAAMDEGAFNR
jgi:hypothetical protein